ncbi:MAG: cytochrome b [Sphingomonadaceae bacterium]
MADGQYAARHYSTVAIWLHWLIAAFVVANILLGFYHGAFGEANERALMTVHKSFGFTVLGLTLLRILWRLMRRPPPLDPALAAWEKLLARVVHTVFYLLLLVLPLSGWLLVSSYDSATAYFGLAEIPALDVPWGKEEGETWHQRHGLIARAMLALVLLHVAGAIKHMFEPEKTVMARMVPSLSQPR